MKSGNFFLIIKRTTKGIYIFQLQVHYNLSFVKVQSFALFKYSDSYLFKARQLQYLPTERLD